MPPSKLGIPWQQIEREPQSLTHEEMMTGHPTAPGFREVGPPRMGMEGPGVDGQPGVPRTRPGKRGQRGMPGQVGPPVQPGTDYLGPHDF